MSCAVFKCGHLRTDENTRLNGGYAACRHCYLVWLKAYRQRTNRSAYELARQQQQASQVNEARRQRRLQKLLTAATATKPHLYPARHAKV
ncbi:MAG: hypothetical protein ACRYFZ_09675 [Janthinobacterium lividum]